MADPASFKADSEVVEAAELVLAPPRHELRGTSEYLLEKLGEEVSDDVKRSKMWPKAANALSRRLNRLAPILREAGIEYSEDEVGCEKKKIKILQRIDKQGEEGSRDDAPADERPEGDGGEASGTPSEAYEEPDDNDDAFEFDFGD
jgi:hypothetical protein